MTFFLENLDSYMIGEVIKLVNWCLLYSNDYYFVYLSDFQERLLVFFFQYFYVQR